MITNGPSNENYGIVIDAGSSGSRINIYKWDTSKSELESVMNSLPHIQQEDGWTFKTKPGLSLYEKKPKKAFNKHIKPLLKFAEDIIPKDKIRSTPVFIQATAGMRLLPEKSQRKILNDICEGFRHSSNFLMQDCESQIQVIDGETEGLYGWLSLNYLHGIFDNYDVNLKEHFTLGFMDMGGASTQIAFSPSDLNQIKQHKEDIPTINLRTLNGNIQQWDVFVSTWLGFGANQARKRYFAQLVNSLPENINDYDDDDYKTRKFIDPCMPKGCESKFELYNKKFTAIGSGHSEQCKKLIYPLLMKHLPCVEEPCLFNGVHAPRIDFLKDKFVGVSEYWYTANDVFKLGGEYNFQEFNTKVKEFCNSNWSDIKKNGDKGLYNSIPDSYLADSCFKANWVLNVLHEGFGLPFENGNDVSNAMPQYPTFQSADKIHSREISWTLGRILLYASGSILAGNQDIVVGVQPSKNSIEQYGKQFMAGGLDRLNRGSKNSIELLLGPLMLIATFFCCCFYFLIRFQIINRSQLPLFINNIIDIIKQKVNSYYYYNKLTDSLAMLEEGVSDDASNYFKQQTNDINIKMRSKSTQNLNDINPQNEINHSLRGNGKSPHHIQNSRFKSESSLNTNQNKLRTAFSLADFSKYKTEKNND